MEQFRLAILDEVRVKVIGHASSLRTILKVVILIGERKRWKQQPFKSTDGKLIVVRPTLKVVTSPPVPVTSPRCFRVPRSMSVRRPLATHCRMSVVIQGLEEGTHDALLTESEPGPATKWSPAQGAPANHGVFDWPIMAAPISDVSAHIDHGSRGRRCHATMLYVSLPLPIVLSPSRSRCCYALPQSHGPIRLSYDPRQAIPVASPYRSLHRSP